ncbi:ABC transporter permease [Bacteroidales bacterium]
MNKTLLILRREYLTRVRKKSFIVMTFLGPLLMAALMVVPVILATVQDVGQKKVAILDETGWFTGKFESTDNILFSEAEGNLADNKKKVNQGLYDALLYIPLPEFNVPTNAELFSAKQASPTVKSLVRNIIKTEIENRKLLAAGIDPQVIRESKATVNIVSIRLDETGSETKSYDEVKVALGFISAIVVYFFIFLFGSQVMRGVIEEKTNRIIEVMVSSVKPFQLMMGKITGIALVGLTQFFLWVALTFILYGAFTFAFGDTLQPSAVQGSLMQQGIDISGSQTQMMVSQVHDIISTINFPLILFSFAFYFLGGYLLYAALFAAIGSAVDNEADTQQFMLPVSLPLILGFVVSNFVTNNPDGPLALWLSLIPFTSPIIMMVRLPFGVPYHELILSIGLLIGGFILTTWLAAKIYRTGILMYGKKITYSELWKWIRYK